MVILVVIREKRIDMIRATPSHSSWSVLIGRGVTVGLNFGSIGTDLQKIRPNFRTLKLSKIVYWSNNLGRGVIVGLDFWSIRTDLRSQEIFWHIAHFFQKHSILHQLGQNLTFDFHVHILLLENMFCTGSVIQIPSLFFSLLLNVKGLQTWEWSQSPILCFYHVFWCVMF